MKTIELIGRYGEPTSALLPISNNTYRYRVTNEFPYGVSYGDNSRSTIVAVDPSDGPMLSIGYVLPNGEKVSEILTDGGEIIIKTE